MGKITICACCSRPFLDWDKAASVASHAHLAGWDVNIIPDLCELVENNDNYIKDIAETVICACHERAIKSLIEHCGEKTSKVINIRTNSVDNAINELNLQISDSDIYKLDNLIKQYKETMFSMPKKQNEDAWFPVIDKDKCIECKKCYDFCPFGVYEINDNKVKVVKPHNCKINCPACARTCPTNAIIFAKYDKEPINGGTEAQDKAVQIDTHALYAEAFRERLAQRRNKINNNQDTTLFKDND